MGRFLCRQPPPRTRTAAPRPAPEDRSCTWHPAPLPWHRACRVGKGLPPPARPDVWTPPPGALAAAMGNRPCGDRGRPCVQAA